MMIYIFAQFIGIILDSYSNYRKVYHSQGIKVFHYTKHIHHDLDFAT